MSEHTHEHTHHHSSEHSHSSHSSHSSHHHSRSSSKFLKTIVVCIIVNAIYLIGEAAMGIKVNSLALISDAAYNLGDLLVLALAFYSVKLKAIPSYMYQAGVYKKYSALSLIINVVILLISVGLISMTALLKYRDMAHCDAGLAISITAALGIIVNGITAWLLYKHQTQTSTIKGAFLNMASDTAVSVVVLAAGIVLLIAPSNTLADPLAAFIAAIIILIFTVRLLYTYIRRGFHLVPKGIEVEQVVGLMKLNPHVKSYRHLNVWRNNSDEVELSVHISLDDMEYVKEVKRQLKDSLRKMGVRVVTLAFKKHKEEY